LGAFLPFVLAGIVTTILIFFLVRFLRNEQAAALSALLFSISSYAIWVSRAGYLEGVEIFFITLSFLFLVVFIYKQKDWFITYWWMAVALSILCKYTAIFLLPAGLIYFIFYHRSIFKKKEFWLGVLSFFILLSPVIIYNIMVFKTRGHFDATLSSMIGLNPEDFQTIAGRVASSNILTNIISFWRTLSNNVSGGLLILYIIAIIYQVWQLIRKKISRFELILFLNTIFIIVMFFFTQSSSRFLPIIVPFLSMSVGILIYDIWQLIKERPKILKVFTVLFLVMILSFEFFYAINTNILNKPISSVGIYFAKDRFYKRGFIELDSLLRKKAIGDNLVKARTIKSTQDILDFNIRDKSVVIIDERIDWFSRLWYLERYRLYYNLPYMYMRELSTLHEKSKLSGTAIEFLKYSGAKNFWIIVSANPDVENLQDKSGYNSYTKAVEETTQNLQTLGVDPIIINNYAGNSTFLIYHFDIVL